MSLTNFYECDAVVTDYNPSWGLGTLELPTEFMTISFSIYCFQPTSSGSRIPAIGQRVVARFERKPNRLFQVIAK